MSSNLQNCSISPISLKKKCFPFHCLLDFEFLLVVIARKYMLFYKDKGYNMFILIISIEIENYSFQLTSTILICISVPNKSVLKDANMNIYFYPIIPSHFALGHIPLGTQNQMMMI